MMKPLKTIVVTWFLCMLSMQHARAENTRIEYEYPKKIEAANKISHLTSTSFGNSTDVATGKTVFSAFDVDLPGSNNLPVRFGRRLSIDYRFFDQELGGVGNWDVEVPYIEGTFSDLSGWTVGNAAASYRYNRCSHPDAPAIEGGTFTAYEVWHGYRIHVPGVLDDSLLIDTSASTDPTDGKVYPWILKSMGRLGCLPSLKNGHPGEGFVLLTKDGTRYYFDYMVERKANTLRKGPKACDGGGTCASLSMRRKRLFLLATRIEDRFGNHVDYQYDSTGRPLSISASDGRLISIQYGANAITVSAHGQVWAYTLESGHLVSVKNPDNSAWRYPPFGVPTQIIGWDESPGDDLLPPETFNPDFYCLYAQPNLYGGAFQFEVTHPGGAVANFEFSGRTFYRSGVMHQCDITYTSVDGSQGAAHVVTPNYFGVFALSKLSVRGSGLSLEETGYDYAHEFYPYCDAMYSSTGEYITPRCYEDPCSHGDCTDPVGRWVTVTRPDGTKQRKRFGVIYAVNEGRLLAEEVLDASGNVVRRVDYQYLPDGVLTAQAFSPYAGIPVSVDPMQGRVQPLVSTQVTEGGVIYRNEVPICSGVTYCFDGFAQPTRVRRSNTSGADKTEIIEYENNLGVWILGLPRKTTVDGVAESETEYNAQALPWRTYRFGKLQQTLTYNTDGTLATVADGRGNVTTLSNWKRGIPQLIRYPATPEAPAGATESATVNDNGWITSVTDENNYVTGYGYDAMGRLASVVYPSGDGVAYHNDLFSFQPLTDADWKPANVSTGQWRRFEVTANRTKITYFDALWRPVLVHEYDAANVGPTLRSVRTEYDASGRVSFQSYPSSDVIPGASGMRTFYDALDRVTRVEQDSELGVLATTTEYLPGLRTRVTNPRNQQVTTSFMAWDQPNYELPILSEQPEGKVIRIDRHPQFGWPLALTQRNAADTLSATRRYVYDGHAQLCKTIEPETGATVTGYDAAGNPEWSAAGLTGGDYANPNDCSYLAASNSGRVTTRTHDPRNRLSQLLFPDGRGNQAWTYTPDSLPASITTYNGPGNTEPVVMAYTYNKRRLLAGESINQTNGGSNWYTWTIGYAYDAYGHLASQTYPTGLTVDYAPNPMGQATKAGSYASGAQYYPNGALKQFTYGNGIVHTMQQNARQLPMRVTATGNAMDYDYGYDANGNVERIYDDVTGTPTARHRWMGYDGLDRLASVASAVFGGTDHTHRFTYDALDNLESWQHTGVKDYADYVYDAQNRLTNIRNTAGATVVGLSYDPQGNLQNKNGQTYDFDYGNRLRNVTAKESYRYDGLGRRVQTTSTTGKTTLWQYSQGGQMLFSSDWGGPDNQVQQTHENVYLAGSLIATIDHAWPSNAVLATKYQHTDALGSPVSVTNPSGQVIERMDYEPWGAIIGNPTRSGIGYTGHVMDGATGLTYMQQRYYDPQIGRFLSVDPVTAYSNPVGAFNRYWYANNSPYKFTDPEGRTAVCDQSSCTIDCNSGLTCAADYLYFGTVYGGRLLRNAFENILPIAQQSESSEGDAPPLPEDLVGTQDSGSRQQGGRVNTGPLAPENGGTGNAETDFGSLTGGKSGPAPEGSRLPEGSQVGENGVIYRPGNERSGPRIDIPANGDKPHETLHYPKPPPPPEEPTP